MWNYSRFSQNLKKSETLSDPFSGPNQSSQHAAASLSKIRLNIVHSYTSWSSQFSLSFYFLPIGLIQLISSPSCYTPRQYWLHHSRYAGLRVQLTKFTLCGFPQLPVNSSLSGPNILISILFSNTFSRISSPIVRDQVIHPYKITGKITRLLTADEEAKVLDWW
jgi:hypothetical protein